MPAATPAPEIGAPDGIGPILTATTVSVVPLMDPVNEELAAGVAPLAAAVADPST